jgi:protein-S-isoprenylcysteine O-methyltransferase Ste14
VRSGGDPGERWSTGRLAVIERLIVMVLPVLFLIVLFGGGVLLRRRNIDQDGEPPLKKALFLGSKYLIVGAWAATVLHSWGIGLTFVRTPTPLRWIALGLWVAGFALLFVGRFGMGASFRLGSPRESTALKSNGLFRVSRNPMYVGVYTTLLAAVLYTLNPIVLIIAAFIVAVHHRIVLAEEDHLRTVFGEAYAAYCRRVRRYL